MPNWSECKLVVTGKSDELERLLIEGKSDEAPLSLEKLVPLPDELHGTTSGSADIGYDAMYGSDTQVTNILAYQWIVEAGVTDRTGLVDFLQRTQPSYIEEAERQKRAMDATGSRNWYEWCVLHWGTKWDISNVRPTQILIEPFDAILQCKGRVRLNFNTAWSPPIEAFNTIAEKFHTLTFQLTYWEGGGGFRGVALWRRGKQVHNHVYLYQGNRGG